MDDPSAYRDYAMLGAIGGVAVATAYWSAVDAVWWWGLIYELACIGVGAILGVVTGAGSVQEAWAGRVGAFVIPLVTLAVASLALAVIAGAQS
jgi:hypothetical protein